ncbi:T9SS type A sorting domain-containing protein [Algoriphagus yeomjeoni]|uniref:T9SS type A sorting domain-containing protein n=1 Tax=Algoriphagus yeomjeoni TaxID=291403 RepID=UPI003CE474D8
MTGKLLMIKFKICLLFISAFCLIPTVQGQILNFNYTGGPIQTYTIPSGVTTVGIEVLGADGGGRLESRFSNSFLNGGKGAKAIGRFSVSPGDVLELRLGAAGTNETSGIGENGIAKVSKAPGGGDASAVYFMNNPLIIAGGGGGSGGTAAGFGGTGSTIGGTSGPGDNSPNPGGSNGSGGLGGEWYSFFSSGLGSGDGFGGGGGGGYLNSGANGQSNYIIRDLPSAGPGTGGAILKGGTGGTGVDAGYGGGGGGGGYSGGSGSDGGGAGFISTSILNFVNGGGGGSFVHSNATNESIIAGLQGGGNGSNGQIIITLNPNIPPIAVAKPLTVSADANCKGTATATLFDGGSTDPDGDPLTFSVSPVGPYTLGVTNVLLTVTDSKGASSTAATTITVEDTTPPVLVVRDVILEIGPDGTADADPTTNGVLVSQYDNCEFEPPIVSNGEVYTCANVGTINIRLTFEDFAGNKTSASYQVTITDPNGVCNQPPVAVAQPLTISADANCEGIAIAADFDGGSTDADGDPLTFSVSPAGPYPLGVTNVTLSVSDGLETSQAITTIIVEDNTAPVVTVPADITVNNDPGVCSAIVRVTVNATDNCTTIGKGGLMTLSGLGSAGSIGDFSVTSVFPVGTTTVFVDAVDAAGNEAVQQSFTVTVLDAEAPVTPVLADATGECSVTVDAPTTTDNCVGTIPGTTNDPTEYTEQGTYQISWNFDDGNGNSTSAIQNVIVKDVTAPVITLITPTPTAVLGLNNTVTLQATDIFAATDNCSGVEFSPTSFTFDCDNLGDNIVSVAVTDAVGNTANADATVTIVDNVPLTIDASESGTPVPLGSDAVLKATVSPAVEGVAVTFYLDNGPALGPALTDASGLATINLSDNYDLGSLPVVYKVKATIEECTGLVESVAYLPIYDPNGNFVTGGGWIMSPEGAYKADESLTGKANFGFVSKYKKGSSQVDGNTEFQFKAGDLNFKSTLHESGTLVISGKKATYRGEGTINGEPDYKFTLVALDGDYNGGSAPDEFRIKIWGESGIIYDNGKGADDNSDAATVLGGGSIAIHEAKGKNKRVVTDLVEVPWNTPSEVIEKKIASMSAGWFDGKGIKLTINTESYNPLAAGLYELKVNVQENEWFALDEPITVNVLVADKPLATDIILSNSILLRNIIAGTVIGDLSTIDPVDDQHTYTIAQQSDFELVGRSLIWKGATIPSSSKLRVFSTDRAGQTIERSIELTREPRFGDFTMFPNPASSEVNLEVELEQSMNVGIRIYDAVGRLVFEDERVQNGISKHQINIDHLSPGLYTVQLKTGKLVMNKRLIKK